MSPVRPWISPRPRLLPLEPQQRTRPVFRGRPCLWRFLMHHYPSDIAFTAAVKNIQTAKGSRTSYAKVERRGWQTRVTPELTEFLAELDMFYFGTVSAEAQPYIQHRGGSPGFLKVLDDKTLAFADFGGNRQFITLGNLSENPKAFIFL